MAWKTFSFRSVREWVAADLRASSGGSWKRSDAIAVIALIAACISGYYSYSAAHSAQLSERRDQVRSEATRIINSYQHRLDYFNCYFTALGRPLNQNNKRLVSLETQLDNMRAKLSLIDADSNQALDIYQSYLNKIPGKPDRETDNMIRAIRAKMSDSQLDRIKHVCTLSG